MDWNEDVSAAEFDTGEGVDELKAWLEGMISAKLESIHIKIIMRLFRKKNSRIFMVGTLLFACYNIFTQNTEDGIEMNNTKVAFICVHNSCRSQIAEALGRHLAGDVFESFSAGTEVKPRINQDAVRLMKEIYNIDMEAEGQHSKLIHDIPAPDIAISMGCNVTCPFIGRPFDENWSLDDPTGQPDEVFRDTISKIESKILDLKSRLEG